MISILFCFNASVLSHFDLFFKVAVTMADIENLYEVVNFQKKKNDMKKWIKGKETLLMKKNKLVNVTVPLRR